jgi:hypothetical protein
LRAFDRPGPGLSQGQQFGGHANIPLTSRRNDSQYVREFRQVTGRSLLTDFCELV